MEKKKGKGAEGKGQPFVGPREYARSGSYLQPFDWTTFQGIKKKWSPAQRDKWAAQQRRYLTNEPSPSLQTLFQGARTAPIEVKRNIRGCAEGKRSPWNAYMSCEITQGELQLALAAILGSEVWPQALALAMEAMNNKQQMSIEQFLKIVFQMAATQQPKSPQEWATMYGNETHRAARARRIPRSIRGGGGVGLVA